MTSKNGTVVVTGSEGFIAHHTVPLLKNAGYDVVPYDLKKGQDVCDAATLEQIFTPGCKVLHLAAVARFADADEDPAEAYRTNVGGTASVLAAAHKIGAERVVLGSTASVYMPVGKSPITEHHPVSGNSHYGYSKAWAERMVSLYQVPFVILRYAHVFGKHKAHGGLIDSFLARVQRGERPIMYGGRQSNDFTYVADIAQANLRALETAHTDEVYNIGTGRGITTEVAVDLLKSLTGYDGAVERRPGRVVDAPRFVLDITKAKRLLGYMPNWTLEEGLLDMLEMNVPPS